MDERAQREVERIRSEYRRRDENAVKTSAWLDRAYRRLMQELEWKILDGLSRAGVDPLGARVLEVGCGGGYFLSRFLDYGAAHAAGIDLMENRVAIARERDPRLDVVVGDAADLPWEDASFDLVTQFTCITNVFDAELRRRIAAEMWRVLRPGGAVVSYDLRRPPAPVRAIRAAAAVRRRAAPGDGTPTGPVEADELRQLFPAAKLDIRPVTLATDLAAGAEHLKGMPAVLGALPFLRTHLLAVGLRRG